MKFVRLLTIVFTLVLLNSLTVGQVKAVDAVSRTTLEVTTAESEQPDNFGLPDSIYIIPISLNSDAEIADDDWYRAIYYYQATRLNQGDFLFHYFLTQDGQIWQGNLKGEDQRFRFLDNNDRPIVIAYLADKDANDFELPSKGKLAEMVIDLANHNAIPLDRVFTRSIEYVAKPGEVVTARATEITGKWDISLKSIKESIKGQYAPVGKTFVLSVESVELPAQPVNIGDNVVVNIKVKNNSNSVLYQGSASEPIAMKVEGSSSKFHVNEVWLSLTQAPLMADGTLIKPGQVATLQMRLSVPLYFGEQTETFQLSNSLGSPYANTRFDIKLNVNRSTKEVVEITKTETGQLNVRINPANSASITSRVTPGQRFFVLERVTGWVKLDLGGGKSGWVVSRYTKAV